MHDAKGQPLSLGDIVLVPCKIAETYATDEYCNVQLKTLAPMHPTDVPTTITLNAKQVIRANADDDTSFAEMLT